MSSNTTSNKKKSDKIDVPESVKESESVKEIDLSHPDLYINRELSLLAFHRRVLAQAVDQNMSLLERLRFLCIASTNLDEFFELRVAGLKQKVVAASVQADSDNLSPQEILNRISVAAHQFVEEQYRLLNENILPALEKKVFALSSAISGIKHKTNGYEIILPMNSYRF
ncbi:Polyphosphate kinase [Beggiatoa sp. PS]|nr:Polyphosphate kinase [Beggiatoa sp. PS]